MENSDATSRQVECSLGMGPLGTSVVVRGLVRRDLLGWHGRSHAPGALRLPWSFATTIFQLTPMARSLRRDETFTSTAFAASLLVAAQNSKPARTAGHTAMEAEWTLQDAKNRFSAVVEAALAGEPQKVVRRGRWMGVVLSAAAYERLWRLALAPRHTLSELLLALPQIDVPFERMELTPREFPWS